MEAEKTRAKSAQEGGQAPTVVGSTTRSSSLNAPNNPVSSALAQNSGGPSTRLGQPLPGELAEVEAARAMLKGLEADPQRLLAMVRRILDRAATARPEEALPLIQLVRPFAALHPVIADATAQVSQTVTTPKVPSTAPNATAATDWTTLITHDARGSHAPAMASLSSQDQAMLHSIATARAAAAAGKTKKVWWDDEPKKGYKGWAYMPRGATTAVAAPQTGKLEDLAVEELIRDPRSQEGRLDAIDTYDGPTNVAIGAGWTNATAADYVRRWIALDPSAKGTLLALGFAVTSDNKFAVVDDTGKLLVGIEANAFLSKSPAAGSILDSISTQISDPSHAQHAMDAQIAMVKSYRIDTLSPALKTAMLSWPPDAVRVAIHLSNWWPVAGPENNPRDYLATGGGAIAILHAFAKNHGGVKRRNGAYILGTGSTTGPMDNFVRWGHGYIANAISGRPIITASFSDAGDPSMHPELAGCVLVAALGSYPGAATTPRLINTGPLVI